MARDVHLFLLRGVVIFLLLEAVFFPFREAAVSILQGYLPHGFEAVWECTGLDEVFLFLAFLWAFPSKRPKWGVAIAGTLLIELFNAARIWIVIQTGDPFLHDVLFRWGGFLFVMILFFVAFRWLKEDASPRGP